MASNANWTTLTHSWLTDKFGTTILNRSAQMNGWIFRIFNPTICIPLAMDEIVHLKYFQEIHNTRNYPCSEAEITFMILDLLPSNVPNATFCQSRRSAHPNEAPNNETIVECICLFIVGTTEISKRSSLHCLRLRASVAHTHTHANTGAATLCFVVWVIRTRNVDTGRLHSRHIFHFSQPFLAEFVHLPMRRELQLLSKANILRITLMAIRSTFELRWCLSSSKIMIAEENGSNSPDNKILS